MPLTKHEVILTAGHRTKQRRKTTATLLANPDSPDALTRYAAALGKQLVTFKAEPRPVGIKVPGIGVIAVNTAGAVAVEDFHRALPVQPCAAAAAPPCAPAAAPAPRGIAGIIVNTAGAIALDERVPWDDEEPMDESAQAERRWWDAVVAKAQAWNVSHEFAARCCHA